MRKVRILPSKLLDKTSKATEPLESPPRPQKLVSLLIVGDSNVGKTSLVRSFVSHESISSSCGSQVVADIKDEQSDGHKEDCGVSTNHSHASSTISRTTTTKPAFRNSKPKRWSVGYYKKDFLFFSSNDNGMDSLQSLRVQIWDTSGIDPTVASAPFIDNEETGTSIDHISFEWKVIWKKASIIVLVVSLEDSWEIIFRQITSWKKWLDDHHHHQQSDKTIVLMLHQADQLTNNNNHHPTFWMNLGGRIADLCQQLQINSWHVTSSCLEDGNIGNSVDSAFRHILSNLPPDKPGSSPRAVSTGGGSAVSQSSTGTASAMELALTVAAVSHSTTTS